MGVLDLVGRGVWCGILPQPLCGAFNVRNQGGGRGPGYHVLCDRG